LKVAIGSDHAGYEVKEKLKSLIEQLGHEPVDKGTDSENSCDYPDYAGAVAQAVSSGECDCGVLVCGTGIGMSMAANKVRGIRAAKVCSEYESKMSRLHNNANVLCIGARSMDYETQIRPIVEAWFATEFEGGRHERRVNKIMALEESGSV
jgi:ribose 5-phosphate isomerase B